MKTKKKNLRIYDAFGKPSLPFLTEKGKFPYGLTMGFEAEFTPKPSYWREWMDRFRIPCDKIPDAISQCFYFKEDSSCGLEMNSFPFNYDWFLTNQDHIKKSISFLKRHGSVNRNCGFHVHISKKFFSKKYAERFCDFFYDNKKFFKDLSLRGGAWALSEYATFEQRSGKYVAVNKTHRNTYEVRIFQGTLNYKVVSAYLQTIYSIAMYTKYDLHPTLGKYKTFLKRQKIYCDGQWLVDNHKQIYAKKMWKS